MSSEVKKDSIISRKAYSFALEIVKCYKRLTDSKKEFVLSKQLLRADTSIGANVNEAISGQSKRDFVHKLNIALKEARETLYWLTLLYDSDYISKEEFLSLSTSCDEIIKILSSIILTTKQRYFSPTHNS
ncbi:MAG: four helix bundle protein [Chitinophagaceae bacterium]